MLRSTILSGITRYWWLPLFTGFICLGLGIWTLCAPMQALPVIAIAFAICLLAVGLFDGVWGVVTSRYNPGWGWDVCISIIDIIAGIWMLTLSPDQMTMAFLYIVGIWLIFAAFNGIGQMFAVSVYNPFATIVAVLLLIVTLFFSFWLLINPIGLGATAWIFLGIALFSFGIYKIAFALKIRKLNRGSR